jgi:hypothetical protein
MRSTRPRLSWQGGRKHPSAFALSLAFAQILGLALTSPLSLSWSLSVNRHRALFRSHRLLSISLSWGLAAATLLSFSFPCPVCCLILSKPGVHPVSTCATSSPRGHVHGHRHCDGYAHGLLQRQGYGQKCDNSRLVDYEYRSIGGELCRHFMLFYDLDVS